MAERLEQAGRLPEALLRYREAAEMATRLHGENDHSDVARCRNDAGACLLGLARFREALSEFEASLAMYRRLAGDADDAHIADLLTNVGTCLRSLGRPAEALASYEASLAMRRRLFGDVDHLDLAQGENNLAVALQDVGRLDEALSHYEAAAAMRIRIHGNQDHPDVAQSLNSIASGLTALGRYEEALPKNEAALAMRRRLYGDSDHAEVARSMNNLGMCLRSLGRSKEALAMVESALEVHRRLHGGRDHPTVAFSLDNSARCLATLGRSEEARERCEAALAMRRRIHGGRDHPEVAESLRTVADQLAERGRVADAQACRDASLAMLRRLYGKSDHVEIARALNGVGVGMAAMGRRAEAMERFEESLAMQRRIYRDRDHPLVASTLVSMSSCLQRLGRNEDAVRAAEELLAIQKRMHGDGDHPDVASAHDTNGYCLRAAGRFAEALAQFETALAMQERLGETRGEGGLAGILNNLGACWNSLGRSDQALPHLNRSLELQAAAIGNPSQRLLVATLDNLVIALCGTGRTEEALPHAERAATLIEGMRAESRTSGMLRQSLFDDLKRGSAFERLQALNAQLGRPTHAFAASERGRSRELLDQFEVRGLDVMAIASRRAQEAGDEALVARLSSLPQELAAAEAEIDALLQQLVRLDRARLPETEREVKRTEIRARTKEVSATMRQLSAERSRLVDGVLPLRGACGDAEIRACLREGEFLLEFTVAADASLLYVVARDSLEVVPLPDALPTMARTLDVALSAVSKSASDQRRGRDVDGESDTTQATACLHELFRSLIPAPVWSRIRSAKRVLIVAHRRLNRLPFDALVTDVGNGRPVHWLESGPPISHVPSGSVLRLLRQRTVERGPVSPDLDALIVGDPKIVVDAVVVPEHGVLVRAVNKDGEGARVGLQPMDVLVAYDGARLVDDAALKAARLATDAAIRAGSRAATPILLEVWRNGEALRFEVAPGPLGIQMASGAARGAFAASRDATSDSRHFSRRNDVERLSRLPQLRGARAEGEAIAAAFRKVDRSVELLVGEKASEPTITEIAARARFLHFACHGIAEEYDGQSLSMLVLAQPKDVQPDDDGLLKMDELFGRWRGRLEGCELVVLSACRTNVGPTNRDDSPRALPLGFLFAGARAVVSSLWSVDDDATRVLMVDFYGRLLAGETDELSALTEAKKALRRNPKYADPFHWAPFLFLGDPD